MQFSAIVNRFIVKIQLISAFTNDLIRQYIFSKNVHSCRLSLFNLPMESQPQNLEFRNNLENSMMY